VIRGISGIILGRFYFRPIEQRALAGDPGDEKAAQGLSFTLRQLVNRYNFQA